MSEPRQKFRETDLLSVGAQLCYIYTLHASNDPACRPRYVGFTCRPNNRESEHHRLQKNGRKGEWVEGLLSIGERAVLTVVHKFRSDDLAERILEESTWIEFYRNKFPDLLNDAGGGIGVAKVSESLRQKKREIMKRHCANPEVRKQRSEQMKRRYADPAQRRKLDEANRQRTSTASYRDKRRELQKKRWGNSEERKRLVDAIRRSSKAPQVQQNYRAAVADPSWAQKQSEGMKKRCADPEIRKQMSEASKRQFSNPKAREKAAEFAKRAWENPEYRAKRAATIARKKLEKELDGY